HDIPVPDSLVITKRFTHELILPVVLKSQVPVGGRGKAGGVVMVTEQATITSAIDAIFELDIKGFKPNKILAEQAISINKEFYLSLLINRAEASIELMAHKNGGVEVEENPKDSYLLISVGGDGEWARIVGVQLAEYYDTPEKTNVLQELVEKLFTCFIKSDATLLEINPLILTTDGSFFAGDCKMELDDAAAFRHPEWNFEDKPSDTSFIELNKEGVVATIANGAGLAMATVDAVADAGLLPANFLDIGGGANEASVLAAFEKIMTYSHVQTIVINIFAGITRCDEVAKAIIAAKKKLGNLPPLFIRLAGTNFEEARTLLEADSIPLLATLEDCLLAAKKEVTS
ncbi:MAG: ATP-grasp domain-containing protein, partial [Candidatus Saccharibacteria bacterium]